MGSCRKQQFTEALLHYRVLEFGSFTTKSGRQSPYFFNSGRFNSGESIAIVANLYAESIAEAYPQGPYYLFGPAYKGIPLAVMTADCLQRLTGSQAYFTFNRKEAKDHGEGGLLVGYPYEGGERVLIIEDVLTGGTSLRASLSLLGQLSVKPAAAFVGVDRGERGLQQGSARREIEEEYKLPIYSLVHIAEIIDLLAAKEVLGKRWLDAGQQRQIANYLACYGASS